VIKVRKYQSGDSERIIPKGVYSIHSDLKERTEKLAALPNVEVFCICDDDLIIGIVGATIIWNGVAEIWAVMSEKVKEYKVTTFKACWDLIDWFSKKHEIHRFFVTVSNDYEVGQRFMRRLGFIKECVMKRYGPDGSDFCMMARVS